MLNAVKKILPQSSLLIFDCGANTKGNKDKILKAGFHYLTLTAKKKKTYEKYIVLFKKGQKQAFILNNRKYECVKAEEDKEVKYVFFSEDLYKDQIKKRKKRFEKKLAKNDSKLYKTKKGKVLMSYISRRLHTC
jgi:transposase